MYNYQLPDNYKTNPERYFNDTVLKDEWQKEVYEYALSVFNKKKHNKIVDFGCGSGYKLIKYFEKYDTVGIDLPITVDYLNQKYPHKNWVNNIENPINCDLFIASDVIEHMANPDVLLDYILICKPKDIIISTPDRNTNKPLKPLGSPSNKCHVREWSFDEFGRYISNKLYVISHFISNYEQSTQLIHAQIKD